MQLLPFLLLPCIIVSGPIGDELKADEERRVEIQPLERVKIPLGTVEGEFLLSLTPCGLIHWKLYRSTQNGEEWDDDGRRDHDDPSNGELVAGEEGEGRMNFYNGRLDGQQLTLVLTSNDLSSVTLFHTSSQSSMDEMYPSLPSDPRVIIAHETTNSSDSSTQSALVTWKINPSIESFPQPSRYRVCVVLSHHNPTSSLLCPSSEINGAESIHCVNQKTNHLLIGGLRPGHKYAVTVFIRDSRHATTSVYEVAEMKVPGGDEEEEESVPRLEDAQMRHLTVQGPRGNSLSYEYEAVGNATKRALLAVYSCGGYVRVSIWRGRKLLKKSDAFTSFRRFAILNANGKLRIEIINDDQIPNEVRLWIGKADIESPYPTLPEDTSVKVVRRGCDWTVLQWLRAGDPRDEYCVYQRKETANLLEELVGRVENDCAVGFLPHSSLVGCYSHKGSSSDDVVGLLETTIRGLSPDSTFRFDVLVRPVNRTEAQSLRYRTVWVRTSSSC